VTPRPKQSFLLWHNLLHLNGYCENICLHSYIISLIAGEIALHCQKSKPLFNTTIGTLHDIGKIVMLLLKRKYPHIKDLVNMIDDSKVGSCLLRNLESPENITKIIEYQL